MQIIKITFLLLLSLVIAACGGGSDSTPQPPPIVIDTTPPVITLNGDASVTHEQGTQYNDPGATAVDETDGSVAVTTSGSVGTDAGSYQLTYSASDAAGNSASLERTVVVEDTQAPIVTLNGDDLIVITVGDSFSDPGASANDVADGTVSVVVDGNVDTETAGDYLLTYTATDNAGNSSTAERTVRVQAEDDPLSNDVNVYKNGAVDSRWEGGINAFDAAINYSECNNDNGAACPSINWRDAQDADRGTVLEVEHPANADLAGLFIKTSSPVNLTDYRSGALLFDIRIVSGDDAFTMKLDCSFPCTSGNQTINFAITENWQTVTVPLAELESSGLNLTQVDTGIVIWASQHQNTTFRLDKIRFVSSFSGDSSISPNNDNPPVEYNLTSYGAATISDTINPASYRCVVDYGNWIYNAGIVEPAIAECDAATRTPTGTPTPLYPHLSGPAATKPVATHRWWGSVSFLGEMTLGDPNDASYITPDPIAARISNTGFRMLGIPAGLSVRGNDFGNLIPDPFSEVFDGIAIANSEHPNLDAYAYDHSDGSVTVLWRSADIEVMKATFVHGSPYVYLEIMQGNLVIKTLRADGGEKGISYQGSQSLGVWTSVAGNTNHFLVSGDGATTFNNINSNQITVENASNAYTVTWLPTTTDPSLSMVEYFQQYARNIVSRVDINYQVDPATQKVTVTHEYKNNQNNLVETITGLHPLHWKNASTNIASNYQTRSARGVIRFIPQNTFSYSIDNVGVLPTLPMITQALDTAQLELLVAQYIAGGEANWNTYKDTYWSGKSYSKAAEIVAITDALGMTIEKQRVLSWLKIELEDWFSAERNGTLDTEKYFVYDENWNTLLGMEESFAAHQQLNDHHFHYGYFVRAAAEICRHDPTWCSDTQYGPIIELLIRDYAGNRNDPSFPYLRHFDPANGFSWASGKVNFVRGNNNESTSEAANAYGAMILYGLITNNSELTDRGIYLHASTAASYWEYWNNIDGYQAAHDEFDNFPEAYNRITTSIIWGDGAVFSTWFSGAFAHILGIQGLPSNTLNLHIGQYADYLVDYVALGLTESSNNKPSGLPQDQWRDLWWNIWAMTDPESSIQDYLTVADYEPEEGESKAHTYHWIYTFAHLGHISSGTGGITADYPAAVVFDKNGTKTYVVYNFSSEVLNVTFSDSTVVAAQPNQFTLITI